MSLERRILLKTYFFNQSIDKQTVATPLEWPIMAMLRKGECDVKKAGVRGGAEVCPNNIFATGRPKPSRRYCTVNWV
jgi:hypothetical protein